MPVHRIYVEKKEEFSAHAKNLNWEINNILKIKTIEKTRIINRYDIEGIDENIFNIAIDTVFCDPLVDTFYFELPYFENIFATEYLLGQYDNRADFCEQCLQLISCKKKPIVKTAIIYAFEGVLSKNELDKIKSYIINPVDSTEASLKKKNSLITNPTYSANVKIIDNFNGLSKKELKIFIEKENLAMSIDDILVCQNYFKNTEKRPPTSTEIKILDAYWSDHCRHTTFNTEIEEKDIEIKDPEVFKAFENYKKIKKELNMNGPISLMEIATIGAKKLKQEGFLKNLDESEEINAASVCLSIPIENKTKKIILMFKNETHNHPTEIEPFGGASTCLGGAIRDPLSGRCYVYQAMRITGAANPKTPIEKTLEGKLPQIKITRSAAFGYSSYGNQIGIATGFVKELYNEGYIAKRMEIGAVIGASLKDEIIRETPKPGDIVIIVGGKTGRDGCGGATGSSKTHNKNSLKTSGAQVQKGNPIEERKLQRLFNNPQIKKIIKKCNDFGAGGVAVAIGELFDGINIFLDKIPKKYEGLSGTEVAISESQERMAVVISKEYEDFFIKKAAEENLQATSVANITKEKRLVMHWNNKKIVDISRKFLNSNGAKRKGKILIDKQKIYPAVKKENTKSSWISHIKNLNICSQKGLVNMFDSTIGKSTVLMPYGGKYKATKTQAMVALIPIKKNKKTVSIMTYGGDPALEKQSPFYGAICAVVESLAKIIATGGSLKKSWLSFQEYFPSIKKDKKRLGLPFCALLGALKAQTTLKVASIGGKDSMSGSFNDLDVPPTLISFAVSVTNIENVISPEFKRENSFVALICPGKNKNGSLNLEKIKETFSFVENLIASKKVISAYAIEFGGIAEAICKMCFGNKIGFKFLKKIENQNLFKKNYGSFILELKEKIDGLNIIGKTIKNYKIQDGDLKIDLKEIEKANDETLEEIFPTKTDEKFENKQIKNIKYENIKQIKKTSFLTKIAKPKILITVFPGTNCEYDIKNSFEKEGGICNILIINNLNEQKIEESIVNFEKKLQESNIIAIPGGFSAADEPDGSAKFIAAFFRNKKVMEATNEFLKEKDGLMLGICNGFQALVKLGLIEHGEICDPKKITATLTYNAIGKHQSTIVNTKILSNNSPWLQYEDPNKIYKIAISHGEGRFIAPQKTLDCLIKNKQIASVYVDDKKNPTMKTKYNPNGSLMAIEGLTSKDGKIFGRMGHSERMEENLYINIPDINYQKIFKAGVDYFR